MSSGIYLAGGGSAVQEAAVWEHMLEGVSRLLYWPIALSGELLANAESWLRTSLGSRVGLEVTVWLALLDHRGEALDGYDLLFVGGGNTYDLIDRFRRAEIAAPLARFLDAGGSYYGGSAGAIVAGPSIGLARGLDSDRHHDPDDSGLGLVPADVLPHFSEARRERAEGWSTMHPRRQVLCIPEASGVHVDRDQMVVLGPEPVDLYCSGKHTGQHNKGRRHPPQLAPPAPFGSHARPT
jgi:dipeptidase E